MVLSLRLVLVIGRREQPFRVGRRELTASRHGNVVLRIQADLRDIYLHFSLSLMPWEALRSKAAAEPGSSRRSQRLSRIKALAFIRLLEAAFQVLLHRFRIRLVS